jgi:hypothetical protein
MNTPSNPEDTRDEVLFAFHQACDNPTAEQIIEWTRRYPQFADDIRAHAAIARDWAARKGFPVVQPDADMLARGHSRVLDALYNAEVAAKAAGEPCESFQEMMARQGTDVPRLARQLDIARSVLADLVNGGVLAPIGKRLVNALTRALNITVQAFDGALQRALNAPRLGHAKADGAPAIIPRPYEEVIRSSNMAPERMEYWLSED